MTWLVIESVTSCSSGIEMIVVQIVGYGKFQIPSKHFRVMLLILQVAFDSLLTGMVSLMYECKMNFKSFFPSAVYSPIACTGAHCCQHLRARLHYWCVQFCTSLSHCYMLSKVWRCHIAANQVMWIDICTLYF